MVLSLLNSVLRDQIHLWLMGQNVSMSIGKNLGETPKILGFFAISDFDLAVRKLQCSREGAGAVRLARLVLPPMSSGRSYHRILRNAVVRIMPCGHQFSYDGMLLNWEVCGAIHNQTSLNFIARSLMILKTFVLNVFTLIPIFSGEIIPTIRKPQQKGDTPQKQS